MQSHANSRVRSCLKTEHTFRVGCARKLWKEKAITHTRTHIQICAMVLIRFWSPSRKGNKGRLRLPSIMAYQHFIWDYSRERWIQGHHWHHGGPLLKNVWERPFRYLIRRTYQSGAVERDTEYFFCCLVKCLNAECFDQDRCYGMVFIFVYTRWILISQFLITASYLLFSLCSSNCGSF